MSHRSDRTIGACVRYTLAYGLGLNSPLCPASIRLLNSVGHKESDMRISARNQIKGKVVDVTKGATTSHVRVDVGGGQVITSSITNEAVDELGLKKGDNVIAVIKASDVMIAVG